MVTATVNDIFVSGNEAAAFSDCLFSPVIRSLTKLVSCCVTMTTVFKLIFV